MKRGGPLRRVALTRNAPLNPGVSQLRRSPLARVSAKRAATVSVLRPRNKGLKPIPAAVRRAVRERDQFRCVAGGCWIGEVGGHVHHRKLRSQGGDNSLANLILLCEEHHRAVHLAVELAYELGYLVRGWDDPATVGIQCVWPDAA